MTDEPLDIEILRQWIGREECADTRVNFELVRRFRATFNLTDDSSEPGGPVPAGLHWCLAPQVAPTEALGVDGHPVKGGFLPPVPLPRRMWAGGALEFERPLRGGDEVHRRSRIDDVVVKQGRAGPLCFVTVTHVLEAGSEVLIRERQDIVYRSAEVGARGDLAIENEPVAATAPATRERLVDPHPILLFRYSALTFNSHRIHYDRRYAVEEEGYAGLVVHGPLQATLLLQFAKEIHGSLPKRFSFRSEAPLFDGSPMVLRAERTETSLRLWTASASGQRAMKAEARW